MGIMQWKVGTYMIVITSNVWYRYDCGKYWFSVLIPVLPIVLILKDHVYIQTVVKWFCVVCMYVYDHVHNATM